MSQQPHIDLTAAPVDLGAALMAGRCYIAQVRYANAPVLYATASVQPADLDDWFSVGQDGFFTFVAGQSRTWARMAQAFASSGVPARATLAIADYP